ncbi:MAG: hypothetical protein CEO22_393 [Candidatus Berkelbacteria bacterium Gr01-1014_85]|uniref:Uncharacterized protein n=1 Tax=Candidatus Berkelbacteria bacterium Gr01-1014_85 TaxID=2017150 RepID=A0A554JBM3_9BACT|nr:MAG: hypothetical protein CEO22_393 [Candidatus Berkelbacteria bacterium Gr01-1014_85]
MSTAGVAAAAAAAAQNNAIAALGSIVAVEPDVFLSILDKNKEAIVITAYGNLFERKYRYLTNYKGLTFFSHNSDELQLPTHVEVFRAKKIWIPR